VLTSVIGAFYYLRWIKIIFFEKKKMITSNNDFFHQMHLDSKNTCSAFLVDREKSLILGLTTLFLLSFFAYPVPLLLLAHKIALAVTFLFFQRK
jgi:NADH:ubiquinone oxidoreductase subunit 2 (subunit N)